MGTQKSPYQCHVFVCINDRGGERKACADQESGLLHAEIKRRVKENGWTGRVRVSKSGCLGQCERGPNVMIYPRGVWFDHVLPADIDRIISTVERLIEE
jgi:(2Fe-2S) ferredoxin